MSTLLIVRHGQARFLTDDYDRLSETGHEQARLVGEHWAAESITPTHVYSGSLKRQRDTAQGALAVLKAAGDVDIEHRLDERLNEFPADELMQFVLPKLCDDDPEVAADARAFEQSDDKKTRYRLIHRQLEAVMRAWIGDRYNVAEGGIARWAEWSGGVRDALKAAMSVPSGSTVAVFTSGGPVGVSVQTVLAAPEIKAAEMNWRVFNASITQMTFSSSRISLDTFNETAHLPPALRTHR